MMQRRDWAAGRPAAIRTRSDSGLNVYRQLPSWFGARKQTGADQFDEEVVDVTLGGETDRILVARRGGGIHRWRMSKFGDLDDGDLSGWVRRVDGGQGMYIDERMIERDGLPTEYEHNPTMLGGYLAPFSSDLVRSILSPCDLVQIETHGSSARIITSTIPFEYDPNGWQGPTFDHGGSDRDTQGLWIDWRMVKETWVNWSGLAGVERITDWSYSPDAWVGTDGPMTAYRSSGVFTMDHFQNAAEFFDPITGLSVSVPSWSITNSGSWLVNGLTGAVENTAGDTIAYPFSGQVGCSIMQGTNDAAGVEAAVGILSEVARGASDGMARANHLTLLQQRNVATVGEDKQRGQVMQVLHKSTASGRRAGWIGHSYYIIHGPTVASIRSAARQLYQRGAVKRQADWIVPQGVIDGMGDLPHKNGPLP